MQISPKDFIVLIGLASIVFLIAPISLIVYVNLYNRRKKKHLEEKELLAEKFEKELLKSQIEVQEQTMQTIASNLHDNIGQLLSLLIFTLSTIDASDHPQIAEKVELSEELAVRSIQEMRELARLLHGQELLSRGLGEAIAFELDYLKKAGLHTINFSCNYVLKKRNPEKETILFRIFQELLNNIVRHADASVINVAVDQDTENLKLMISDNGKGFDEEEVRKEKKGMGIYNIRKRVQVISGFMDVKTAPHLGTETLITVPHD